MKKPSILVLSFSNLGTDPRVNRQIRLLRHEYQVTAAGFADPGLEGVEFIPLPSRPKTIPGKFLAAWRLKSGSYRSYYWHIDSAMAGREALRQRSFDVILANDSTAWPLAAETRGRARLLFDMHEYTPREFEDILWWRVFQQPFKTWVCREYLPQADGCLSVCDGIADEYHRVFGIPRPLVVRNTPAQQAGAPQPTPPDRVRLIHHGLASRSRRIETMIDLIRHLDQRFTLDLMLVARESGYIEQLRARAAGDARIRFREPVPSERIVAETRDYDMGLFLLPPTNFNYRFALPNKLFEFIQARLAVAIGPSPEMARLVREHDCGVVANDFEPATLGASLSAVTAAQIDGWKQHAHRAADVLCWENESRTLLRELERLISLGPCAA